MNKKRIMQNPAVGFIGLLLVFLAFQSIYAVGFVAYVGSDWASMSYAMKIAVMVFNSLIFALTGLVARPLVTGSWRSSSPSRFQAGGVVSVVIIAFLIQPFIACCSVANETICRWPFVAPLVGEPNTANTELLASVMKYDNLWTWALSILVLAIIPAICEEICFRWALLPAIRRMTGGWHSAIVISAILFSAIHMDAYGFIPRFVLGLLLGAIFISTRNIWAPIAFHCCNNAMVVVSYGLSDMNVVEAMEAPTETPNIFITLISLAFAAGELYFLDLNCRNPQKIEEMMRKLKER